MPANPYNCSIPSNFVGYENERAQIIRKLAEGHSYTILGGQQCGKTSFLLQLEKDLSAHRGAGVCFMPRRFDLQAEFPKTVAEFFGCLYRLTTQGLKVKRWTGAGYTDFLKAMEVVRAALEKRFTKDWVVVFLVSGDFADRANEDGFRIAKEFLLHLVDQKLVIRPRLILAPGNHDLVREKDGFEIVAKAPEGVAWSKPFELGAWVRGARYMSFISV